MHGFYDVGITPVHTQEMRDFYKIFTALPGTKFQEVLGTDLKTNLAIRELREGGTHWFYVVNPGYYPVDATLILNNINSVYNVLTEQTIPTPGQLQFSLDPFDIIAFRTTDSGSIAGYSIAPVEQKHLAHMENLLYIVTDVYPDIKSELSLTADEENFINTQSNLAKQDIENHEYAAAWSKISNYRFWMLAFETIFRHTQLLSQFSVKYNPSSLINFDASRATTYQDPIMIYEWIFGDGSTGLGKTIDHNYPSGGVFTVRLDITDRGGHTNRIIKNILVSGSGESRADINHDTYVDLFDIVEITVNFGLTSGFDPPEVDTNDDGEIDIFDLVYVASRIGTRVGTEGGTPVPQGQVAHWTFNQTLDDSENNNHGTFLGNNPIAYMQGKVGDALVLDGNEDYVQVDHDSSLNPTNEMTIAAWVYISDDGVNDPVVVKADSSSGYYLIVGGVGGVIQFTVYNGGTYSDINTRLPYWSNWHHVAGTFSPTEQVIYVDGVERRRISPTISSIGSSTSELRIGRSTTGISGGASRVNGRLDEIRIFSRALTSEEIVDVMYKGLPVS
jgi:hypothetical protein